ncbi:peptide ABC transporter substrate-binding protein [Streptococcus mitis]|uniref:ABC transporter, substrate-binding protein, family 5 n=1 Tax=Streptococcus mitis ATCC 6249 TaxID=864567 RepID=E0PT57_STRMT|nr:ABC transporter substrate-binding protein [Streptococcus mitis]EFM30806.1 ABC transporter, substrate-binding protein, family 5 [Streptococcus mitis ATCC 6249]
MLYIFAEALLLGAGILSASFLMAACGSTQSNAADKTYSYVFASNPDTLDYITSTRGSTSSITTNLIDGLLENDKYGNLVPSMAESWTVSKDGLTYTYKIRQGAKWYTSEGEEYAEVTAHDFVTGLKYAADKKAENLYLVQDSIKGLADYVEGKTSDFETVGVKAVDDYTLQYTLNKPESYWNSKTTGGILSPVNEAFLKSKGDDFGSVTPSSILSNGPYLFKSFTSKSLIEFEKNPNYWDKDNVKIEKVKLSFYDGSDQDSLARGFLEGNYTDGRIFPTSSVFDQLKKGNEDKITYTPQNAVTFYYLFNVNRQSYNQTMKQTDKEKTDSRLAMQNKDFRQAINFAFDRHAYAAQTNGEDGADRILRNTVTPSNFVQIGGKNFGDAVNEKIVNYGTEWSNINLNDAQPAFLNADKAKAEFAKAKESLQAEGVTFPIHLDMLVDQTAKLDVQQASSFKQTVEETLGSDNIVIDVIQLSPDEKDNATFFADTAEQKDYDIDISGWSGDYSDPKTYLDLLDPESGSQLKNLGLTPGKDNDVKEKIDLSTYKKLLDAAENEVENTQARYEKFAEVQAWLTDSALFLPVQSGGANPIFRKTVPFTGAFSFVGHKGDADNYKYVELQKEPVTAKQYQELYEKWQKEKAESNKKAQEDLAKHIQ